MYSLWIQSQMADLIILKKHPEIIEEFVTHPATLPSRMVDERSKYWQKNFSSVKSEFEEAFPDQLTDDARHDLSIVNHLRNAIAHSHVSIAREYLLYRPTGGSEREQKIIEELGILQLEGAADPVVFKLHFANDERYHRNFASLTRLDEVCFRGIAESLDIPHSRIR